MPALVLSPLLITLPAPAAAPAQDKGSVNPKPLPPLANPNDPKIGAKELFGRKLLPAAMPTRVIGFYAKGCIAGAEALPINGDTWQVMRLSRNRNWAHPDMIALLKRLSAKAHKDAGWPGILVGDMSQPRGGPMLTGHASHQIGLDADIWLTPMPDRSLSRNEREEMSAVMMVRDDRLDIDPKVWTPAHLAGDPRRRAGAERGAHLRQCRDQEGAVPRGQGRPQLAVQGPADVRPRLSLPHPHQLPAGQRRLREPAAADGGEGCSAGDLAYWFRDSVLHPKPPTDAAEAEAADDAGAIAGGMPAGAARAGREAVGG